MATPVASGLDRLEDSILPVTASSSRTNAFSGRVQPGDTGSGYVDELYVLDEVVRRSARPESVIESFEDFLQNQARSNDQIGRLFYNYKTFKDKPGLELFKCLLYADFVDWQSEETACPPGKEKTFSELLDIVKNALQQLSPELLHCCILTSVLLSDKKSKSYSHFKSELSASAQLRSSIPYTSVQAILYTIKESWRIAPESLNGWPGERTRKKGTLENLPSNHSIPVSPTPGNQEWTYLDLCWFKDIHTYTSDMSVYIWEPHLEPILPLEVTICISPWSQPCGNIFIYFRPPASYQYNVQKVKDTIFSSIPETLKACPRLNIKALSVALAVFKHLILDTSELIDATNHSIEILIKEGKRSPSVDKMNYTIYLSDSLTLSAKALAESLIKLDCMLHSPPIPAEDALLVQDLESWRSTINQDIKYLLKLLEELDPQILQLRNMIKEQLDYRQFRLTTTLAILAAIYLPFSFISTFFGMNLRDPLWSSSSKASNNSTPMINNIDSSGIPGLLKNHTDSIVNAVLSDGSHLFTLKEFLYIAFTTTFITLGIPLLGIKLLRAILQSFLRNIAAWRVLLIVLLLTGTVIIGIYIPWYSFFTISVPQIAFGMYKFIKGEIMPPQGTWRTRRWQKRWMVYVALSTVCAFNAYVKYPFWNLMPIVYLFFLGCLSNDGQLLFEYNVLSKDTTLKIPNLRKKHHKHGIWILSAFYIALSISSLWNPVLSIQFNTFFFGIYTGLYAMNMVREALILGGDPVEWVGFVIFSSGSICLDAFITYSSSLPTLPFCYRVIWRLWKNDQAFIGKYLPGWMNFRRGTDRAVDIESSQAQEAQHNS